LKDQEEMKKRGDKGIIIKKRKLFCNGKSGNKQGWSDAGCSLFNALYHILIRAILGQVVL
jgi:hypothetical protein